MQVIAQEKCLMECGPLIKCTIQDILYQTDYGGRDYAYGVKIVRDSSCLDFAISFTLKQS